MIRTVSYLGFDFLTAERGRLRDAIVALASDGRYHYVVTPNVDHIAFLAASDDEAVVRAYHGASARLCDSRIIAAMARLFGGRRLVPYPGSDLTRELIETAEDGPLRMAVIGPDEDAFETARRRYPGADLRFIASDARLLVGSARWRQTLERVRDAEWDVLFVCLSFPKQELFAHGLSAIGRGHGVALCVGASIDFLTGAQQRAPLALQKVGLEWLYRLVSDPRRLWRRYLLRGPTILVLVLRQLLNDIGTRGRRTRGRRNG